jgi:hypothetical protein
VILFVHHDHAHAEHAHPAVVLLDHHSTRFDNVSVRQGPQSHSINLGLPDLEEDQFINLNLNIEYVSKTNPGNGDQFRQMIVPVAGVCHALSPVQNLLHLVAVNSGPHVDFAKGQGRVVKLSLWSLCVLSLERLEQLEPDPHREDAVIVQQAVDNVAGHTNKNLRKQVSNCKYA